MIYLVLAALVWGSSFPVIQHALGGISPILFVVLRFTLAFIVLLPRYHSARRSLFRRDLFLISLPNALGFTLQFKAQELTTASKTALFVNSAPVFVAILGTLFFKDRFTTRQLLAAVIAMGGIVIVSTRLEFSDFTTINLGDVMGIGCGMLWAVFILLSAPVVKRYGPYECSQAIYFWTALLAVPLLVTEPLRFAWHALPWVVYLTVFPTLLGYFFFLRGVRTVPSLSTAIIILIEVVVAFAISHFFLGESFSPLETVGVVMVMTGVVLVMRKDAVRG